MVSMPRGSEQIKKLRMQTQLSQNKFASRAGMDSATFRKAENGKENVAELTISRIATTFGTLLKKQINADDLTAPEAANETTVIAATQADAEVTNTETTPDK